LNAATSRELIDTARAAGVFLMEAMWTRCNPAVRRMMELIADGAIGEVRTVKADFGITGGFGPEHRLRDPALGGGALLDLGIYPITVAHLALGRPDSFEAWASLTPEGVDENTGLVFGYASGALATLSCGFVGSTGITATIAGQTGRIELPPIFFRPLELILHRDGAEPEVFPATLPGHGYTPQAEEVHRCLREGLTESPLVSHAITLEMMSLLDEIRARIGVTYPEEARPVSLPTQHRPDET